VRSLLVRLLLLGSPMTLCPNVNQICHTLQNCHHGITFLFVGLVSLKALVSFWVVIRSLSTALAVTVGGRGRGRVMEDFYQLPQVAHTTVVLSTRHIVTQFVLAKFPRRHSPSQLRLL